MLCCADHVLAWCERINACTVWPDCFFARQAACTVVILSLTPRTMVLTVQLAMPWRAALRYGVHTECIV
jgi:hypothetical protein